MTSRVKQHWEDDPPSKSQLGSIKRNRTILGIKRGKTPVTKGEAWTEVNWLHWMVDKRREILKDYDVKELNMLSRIIRERRRQLRQCAEQGE